MLKRFLRWLLKGVDVKIFVDGDLITLKLVFHGFVVYDQAFDIIKDPQVKVAHLR